MAIINWQLRSAFSTTDIYDCWILVTIVEISWPATLYYSMLSLDHISSSELVQYSRYTQNENVYICEDTCVSFRHIHGLHS